MTTSYLDTPKNQGLRRVTRSEPCPICQHPDWCSVAADRSVAICLRVESQRQTKNGGWLHRLTDRTPIRRRSIIIPDRAPSLNDLPSLAANYASAVNPVRLQRLADDLGLSVESLRRLRVGWAHDHGVWAFPMIDAAGKVLGIRLRLDNGRKFAVTGGHEGVFIPDDFPHDDTLLICPLLRRQIAVESHLTLPPLSASRSLNDRRSRYIQTFKRGL